MDAVQVYEGDGVERGDKLRSLTIPITEAERIVEWGSTSFSVSMNLRTSDLAQRMFLAGVDETIRSHIKTWTPLRLVLTHHVREGDWLLPVQHAMSGVPRLFEVKDCKNGSHQIEVWLRPPHERAP